MRKVFLSSTADIRFPDLLKICTENFGVPQVIGCHYIFETPWEGDPVISIQEDGEIAKPYQVKIVINAIKRLEEMCEKH